MLTSVHTQLDLLTEFQSFLRNETPPPLETQGFPPHFTTSTAANLLAVMSQHHVCMQQLSYK